MVDGMVIVAPVDLLSIVHQAAERPVPSQMFGDGECATPEMQAQMLELHLQRRQLMAATAQQLHLLQQRMHDLHMAAMRGASPQQAPPVWKGLQRPIGANRRQSAAESSPAAAGSKRLVAPMAAPALGTSTPSAAAAAAAGGVRPLESAEQLSQSNATGTSGANTPQRRDQQPASGALQQRHEQGQQAGELDPAAPQPQRQASKSSVPRAGAGDRSEAARQPPAQQQPAPQAQRLPSADGGWVPAHSKAPRARQQLRAQPAGAVEPASAVAVAAKRTSSNPNRYAMLPEASSPGDPSSVEAMAVQPPASEAAPSAAMMALKAAAAGAASAQTDGAGLLDAAVQTPQLLLPPGGNPAAEPPSKIGGAASTAVQGTVSDRSPPHPSTPRQPADEASADSVKPAAGCSAASHGAANGPPADATSAACAAAAAAADAVSSSDDTATALEAATGCVPAAAAGEDSSSAGADADSASLSTATASLASASDDGIETRAERQRQRQRAKQGRQKAARRTEAQRRQEEEALLAAAAKDRAEGLVEQRRQQREQEEARARQHAALQASLKMQQEAQHCKQLPADGLGQQMPLFAMRGNHTGSMAGGAFGNSRSSAAAGAFRFNFPVAAEPAD